MRRAPIVAVVALAFLAGVPACWVWNQAQRSKTASCLASTARALHEGGRALEAIRAGDDGREWAPLDRAQTSGVLATVRASVGDCSGWAADGALLDAWGEPVIIEVGRTAGGRFPFRLRSGAADGSAHTTDDVTYEAFWRPDRPAR